MELTDHPDRRVRHRRRAVRLLREVPEGGGGDRGWSAARSSTSGRSKAEITEHQLLEVRCGLRGRDESGGPGGGDGPGAVRAAAHGGAGIYLWHGQFLSRDRACQALSDLFGCTPSPGALAAQDAEDRRAARPGPGGRSRGVPGQRGGRALRRDRVPHRREAGLGALRLVGPTRAGHRARQARQGRHDGRRGAAVVYGASPATTRGSPTTRSRTSQATHCATRTCCGNWRRSPRPATDLDKSLGAGRRSTRSWP